MQKLIESAVDFLQSRMKDSPLHFFEMKMAVLEEKLAFEIFKRWKIPWKFQPSPVKLCFDREDMGIYNIIAMVNFGHLPCKPERHDLERTLSL
jgi:hypothetical protein